MKNLTALLAASVFGLASVASVSAFELDQKAVEYKKHILYCFGLLLTDPEKRAAECGTGPASTGFSLEVTNHGESSVKCAPPTEWNGRYCEWPEGGQ